MPKSKKPSKNKNLPKNNIKRESNFLIFDIKTVFNYLKLDFTKFPIFYHFDLECYIQIEINLLDYVISGVLSQLASRTNLDKVVTKTNLG